jgi:hypothetical protein
VNVKVGKGEAVGLGRGVSDGGRGLAASSLLSTWVGSVSVGGAGAQDDPINMRMVIGMINIKWMDFMG